MRSALTWAPDQNPRTAGVLPYVYQVIPAPQGGYRPFRSAIDLGWPAQPVSSSAVNSGFVVQLLTAATRVFGSNDTNLYEITNTPATPSWTSQATLVSSTGQVGVFAQYANSTVFANLTNATLISTTSGPFSTLTGASKAACIAVCSNIMLLGNYNDGSSVPDGFHASDLEDISSAGWTTGTAGSYAMKGRLIDTPGPITAGTGFGDQALFFKKRGVYAGQFTRDLKNPWDFRCISRSIGCISASALLNCEDFVTWVGQNDIYIYDGAQIRSIADGFIRNTFFTSLAAWEGVKWKLLHDAQEKCIYYFYEGTYSAAYRYRWLVYNYGENRWGQGQGYGGSSGGVTAVFNCDLSDNSAFTTSDLYKTAFVLASTDGKVKKFDGSLITANTASTEAAQSVYSWVYGDGNKEYESTRVRAVFGKAAVTPEGEGYPSTSTAAIAYGERMNVTSSAALGAIQSDGTFDGGVSARWQQIRLTLSGNSDTDDYLWVLQELMLVCGDEEGPCIGGRR